MRRGGSQHPQTTPRRVSEREEPAGELGAVTGRSRSCCRLSAPAQRSSAERGGARQPCWLQGLSWLWDLLGSPVGSLGLSARQGVLGGEPCWGRSSPRRLSGWAPGSPACLPLALLSPGELWQDWGVPSERCLWALCRGDARCLPLLGVLLSAACPAGRCAAGNEALAGAGGGRGCFPVKDEAAELLPGLGLSWGAESKLQRPV